MARLWVLDGSFAAEQGGSGGGRLAERSWPVLSVLNAVPFFFCPGFLVWGGCQCWGECHTTQLDPEGLLPGLKDTRLTHGTCT